MKKCYRCKKEFDKTEFNKKSASKDGLSSYCRTCSREKYKENYNKRRQHHINRAKVANSKTRKRNREFILDVKIEYGCALCWEDDPVCMDFHHLDPNEKDGVVSIMVGEGYSLDKIKTEINKCVCLCSNCHRKVHAGSEKVYKYHLCKI